MKCWLSKSFKLVIVFSLMFGAMVYYSGFEQIEAYTQAQFYVDPVNGDDSNNGTSPANAFLTMEKARDAVRSINDNMTGDIIVYLMPGNYFLTDAIEFNASDSGTNGHYVIWRNYGEKGSARIIGGQAVSGWTLHAGNIYKADVGEELDLKYIYENSTRAILARHPNNGYLRIGSKDANQPFKRFRWKAGNVIPSISNLTDLEVEIWPGNHDWSNYYRGVASINYGNRWITLESPIPDAYMGDLKADSRYRFQGAIELLDQPGEFYYDSTNGELYYYPYNTPIEAQEIIIPHTIQLFNFDGSSHYFEDSLVGHWKFENNTDDESSSNNDGTAINGPAYVTSKTGLGQAISLNGTDEYVTIPHNSSLTFGAPGKQISISAWIKTSVTGKFLPVVTKARPNDTEKNIDYRFGLDDNGKLELRRVNKVSGGGIEAIQDSDGVALNDGNWHHIAFVNEGVSSHKLYVDGQLVEESSATWLYNDSNDEEVNVGRYKNATYFTDFFEGEIDDVRIYQAALTETAIQDIYEMNVSVPQGEMENIIIEGLKFDATNLDNSDEIGRGQGQINLNEARNITIRNNEFYNAGGGAIFLTGSHDVMISGNYIDDVGMAGIRLNAESNNNIIRNNRVNNTGQAFADWGGNIALNVSSNNEISYNHLSTSSRHGITMRRSDYNTVKFNEVSDMNKNSQDTGGIYFGRSIHNTIDNNRVHHSGKFGRGQTGIYVEDLSDDNLITNNIVYAIGNASSNTLNTSIRTKGMRTEVINNIFDFSTSHSAVRSLTFGGFPVEDHVFKYNIFASFGTKRNHIHFVNYSQKRVDQSDYNLFYKTATGSNQILGIPGANTLSNWKSIQNNKYDQNSVVANPQFVDRANGDYTLEPTSPALALGFQQINQDMIGLKSEFVFPETKGQWSFNDQVDDISLNGNEGTMNGNATYTTDRFGNALEALSLDGATGYVKVVHNSSMTFGDPDQPFTISAWMQTSASGAQTVVGKSRPNSSSANIDYMFGLSAAGNLQLWRWNQESSGGAESVTDTDGMALNDGKWHHIAFVNEHASSHKLYIDGELVETSTDEWSYNNGSTQPLEIGRFKNGSTSTVYFDGLIDDVSIVKRALTADEVKVLNHIPLAP